MSYDEIYESLITLFETWKIEHNKHVSGNTSAGGRARKAIGQIKNLCTPYRKESVVVDKERKDAK
jgi:ABC-type sulfate transport system substrate-binding protein